MDVGSTAFCDDHDGRRHGPRSAARMLACGDAERIMTTLQGHRGLYQSRACAGSRVLDGDLVYRASPAHRLAIMHADLGDLWPPAEHVLKTACWDDGYGHCGCFHASSLLERL